MSTRRGRAVASAEVSHVIVRACTECQHRRVTGEPCAGCGNPRESHVDRVGVTNASYRNPLRQMWWRIVRRHVANWRVRRANADAATLRRPS